MEASKLFLLSVCLAVIASAYSDLCVDRCTSVYDKNQEIICKGACEYCSLQLFKDPKSQCSTCNDSCTKRYTNSEDVKICKIGCSYAMKATKAPETILHKMETWISDKASKSWNSAKSLSQWAWKKASSFLDCVNKPNKPATGKPHKPIITKLKAPVPKEDKKDGSHTFLVTRLHIMFFGPQSPPESPKHQALPLTMNSLEAKTPSLVDLLFNRRGGNHENMSPAFPPRHSRPMFPGFPGFPFNFKSDASSAVKGGAIAPVGHVNLKHQRPMSPAEISRMHMVVAWLDRRRALRPLMALCAGLFCTMLGLAISSLVLMIRAARQRRTRCQGAAARGRSGIVYTYLPKYDELSIGDEKADLLPEDENSEAPPLPDKAHLTV